MVACGAGFTLVATELGDVWGSGGEGQLGMKIRENHLLPAFVGDRDVFGVRMVMVAAGGVHPEGVTADGALLT